MSGKLDSSSLFSLSPRLKKNRIEASPNKKELQRYNAIKLMSHNSQNYDTVNMC